MVQYLDNKGHIVGASCGDITNNIVDIDFNAMQNVLSLLNDAPVKKGYITYLIDLQDENSEYHDYSYIYEKIPISELSNDELKEVLQQQVMDSIIINSRPIKKEGYDIRPILHNNVISWEFVKIENTIEGTYTNPIYYVANSSVEKDKWYTDGTNIWEAIKTGVPINFLDKEFFDIIE